MMCVCVGDVMDVVIIPINTADATLHIHTRCTLVRLRTNKSPFLKSYLHKVNANTHTLHHTVISTK